MNTNRLSTLGILATATLTAVTLNAATLYVSPTGNDQWSGKLEAPNAALNDGPLSSLVGARDAVRRLRAEKPAEPVTVLFRGGIYSITEPVVFTPADSGTEKAPIRYAAYPGEKPILEGGINIEGWSQQNAAPAWVDLPDVKSGKWAFRQLFANNRRLIRARTPNVDSKDPLRKGFFYVASDMGGFGCTVGCIHNRGDWIKYEVTVPADGEYVFWMYYGAANKNTEWQTFKMDGRTTLKVDDREPILLTDLPDTGKWSASRWGRAATFPLSRGTHTLVWKNIQGGGINIDAYILCDDPQWKPVSTKLSPPANGKHMVLFQAEKFVESHGKQLQVGVSGGDPKMFLYTPGDIKPEWASAPGAEIHIFQSGSCRAFKEILGIASVDEKEHIVHVKGTEAKAGLRAGDRYFIENTRDSLDAPGEWFLDQATGRLHLIPDADIGKTRIVAPVTCEVVRFEGEEGTGDSVRHITFSGFIVRFTDLTLKDGCAGYGMGTQGVFLWNQASDCRIENCLFENCGRYALATVDGTRNSFVGNTVRDSAQGGVLVIDSDHCVVTDNTMERLGAIYKHIGGVVLTGPNASDNLVAHNLIRNSSRYGITCKNAGFRNLIENNALYGMSLETYDTGGIEVTQHSRTQQSLSTIRNNLIVDVIGYSSTFDKPVYLSWGIYLDSFAGGYTIENNISVRSSHGFMIQGGQGNTVRNNIFIGGHTVQLTLNNYAGNSKNNEFTRNIVYWDDAEAGPARMGRKLEETLVADHNLFFCTAKSLENDDAWKSWREKGFGEHSLIADPLFEDVSDDDYRLKRNSPALELGFKPIDMSGVGPRSEKLQ